MISCRGTTPKTCDRRTAYTKHSDLVTEMQEWFIANSADGEAPDESTIRRRIRALWQELNPG